MELELHITGSTTPRQLQAAATLLLTLAGMEVETPKAATATTAKANKTATVDAPAKNDTPATEGKALTLQDITERAQTYCGKDAVRKAKMRDVLDKLGAVSLSKLKEAHYLSFITELETD